MESPKVVVVGSGRAGTGVGLAMSAGGVDVTFISRRPVPVIGPVPAVRVDDPAAPRGPCVFIVAVPDHKLPVVLADLVARGIVTPDAIVGHLSGAMGSDCLDAAGPFAGRFSAHPLFSFPLSGLHRPMPPGTPVMIEGDRRGLEVAKALFKRANASAAEIDPAVKPLYHAAAVACANLSTVLVAWSSAVFKKCRVPDPMASAASLMGSIAANLTSDPAASTVTGPFARGDAATIASNLAAADAWNPDFGQIYRFMGGHLADWLRSTRVLGERQWKELKEIVKIVSPEPPKPKPAPATGEPWWARRAQAPRAQETATPEVIPPLAEKEMVTPGETPPPAEMETATQGETPPPAPTE